MERDVNRLGKHCLEQWFLNLGQCQNHLGELFKKEKKKKKIRHQSPRLPFLHPEFTESNSLAPGARK